MRLFEPRVTALELVTVAPFGRAPSKDKALQDTLEQHMACHIELPGLVKDAGEVARVLKSYNVVMSTTSAVDGLQRARAHAKRCMGVQYALEQILKHMPAKPEQIPDHAIGILQRLSQKGIGPKMVELPMFMQRVLQKMKEVKQPKPEETAPGAGAVAS